MIVVTGTKLLGCWYSVKESRNRRLGLVDYDWMAKPIPGSASRLRRLELFFRSYKLSEGKSHERHHRHR